MDFCEVFFVYDPGHGPEGRLRIRLPTPCGAGACTIPERGAKVPVAGYSLGGLARCENARLYTGIFYKGAHHHRPFPTHPTHMA